MLGQICTADAHTHKHVAFGSCYWVLPSKYKYKYSTHTHSAALTRLEQTETETETETVTLLGMSMCVGRTAHWQPANMLNGAKFFSISISSCRLLTFCGSCCWSRCCCLCCAASVQIFAFELNWLRFAFIAFC